MFLRRFWKQHPTLKGISNVVSGVASRTDTEATFEMMFLKNSETTELVAISPRFSEVRNEQREIDSLDFFFQQKPLSLPLL